MEECYFNITPPWLFSTVLKLHKRYQSAQSVAFTKKVLLLSKYFFCKVPIREPTNFPKSDNSDNSWPSIYTDYSMNWKIPQEDGLFLGRLNGC